MAQLKAQRQADVLAILRELDSLRYRAATEWWFGLARAAVIRMALVVLACAAIDPEFLQNSFHDPRLAVHEAWVRLTGQHGLP